MGQESRSGLAGSSVYGLQSRVEVVSRLDEGRSETLMWLFAGLRSLLTVGKSYLLLASMQDNSKLDNLLLFRASIKDSEVRQKSQTL